MSIDKSVVKVTVFTEQSVSRPNLIENIVPAAAAGALAATTDAMSGTPLIPHKSIKTSIIDGISSNLKNDARYILLSVNAAEILAVDR